MKFLKWLKGLIIEANKIAKNWGVMPVPPTPPFLKDKSGLSDRGGKVIKGQR